MDRKARDRKLWKRSFDYKEGAVWLAFKARGFVVGVKKGRKGGGKKGTGKISTMGKHLRVHLAWVTFNTLVSCLDATSVLCAASFSGLSTNTMSVPCLRQNIQGFPHIQFWGFAKVLFRCLVQELCLWFVRMLFSCFLQGVFRYLEQELFRVTNSITALSSYKQH